MEAKTFERLRTIIFDNAGINLDSTKESLLVTRLRKRLKALELSTEKEYLEILESDATGTELINLINVISTNTTYFFREADHFAHYEKLLQTYTSRREVRIWCAAASTGEEPYTLAMIAHTILGTKARILATDISTTALSKATNGVYPLDQVKPIPTVLRKKYFHEDETAGQATVSETLKKMILFGRHNLSQFPYTLRGELDIIFCRNVMIYFDTNLREKIAQEMYRMLRPGGYLYIAHAESFSGLKHSFQSDGPSIYFKPGDA